MLSLLDGSIGKLPIADIAPIDVLEAVRRIERKGNLESARRTLHLAGAVFRYGVATARITSDPTGDLRGALLTPSYVDSKYDSFVIAQSALFVPPGRVACPVSPPISKGW